MDPELQRNAKSSPGCVSSVILRMVSLREVRPDPRDPSNKEVAIESFF